MTGFSLSAKLALYASILALCVGLAWRAYYKIDQGGYNRADAVYKARDLESIQLSAKRASRLQYHADKLTEEQNAKDEDDRRRIAALSASLRNRAERPSAIPNSPSVANNCTGAGLYRADGEFLSWYAGEAARFKQAFERCEVQYNEVRGAARAD